MESNVGSAATANCAECSLVFPVENMIRYKNVYVCANCKPVFMQKLSEGAQINTGEFRWAGFWIRFAARFVDGIVMTFVIILVIFVPVLMWTSQGTSLEQILASEERTTFLWIAVQVIGGVIGLLYEAIMTGRWGATLGKMACGIKVVLPDGRPISYALSFGRYFAKLLSSITIYIGFIMAAFDGQKRGLHDRICNTRVVYR